MEANYDKITGRFEFGRFYEKKEVLKVLTELGIANSEKGLLNKLSNEISLRIVYIKGGHRLKFMKDGKSKLYQMVAWNQDF